MLFTYNKVIQLYICILYVKKLWKGYILRPKSKLHSLTNNVFKVPKMSEGVCNANGRARQSEDAIQMEVHVRGRMQSKWKSISEGGCNQNGSACQREDAIQMEVHVRGRMQSKWKSMSEGEQLFSGQWPTVQHKYHNVLYLFYTPQIIFGDCNKMFVPDRR